MSLAITALLRPVSAIVGRWSRLEPSADGGSQCQKSVFVRPAADALPHRRRWRQAVPHAAPTSSRRKFPRGASREAALPNRVSSPPEVSKLLAVQRRRLRVLRFCAAAPDSAVRVKDLLTIAARCCNLLEMAGADDDLATSLDQPLAVSDSVGTSRWWVASPASTTSLPGRRSQALRHRQRAVSPIIEALCDRYSRPTLPPLASAV